MLPVPFSLSAEAAVGAAAKEEPCRQQPGPLAQSQMGVGNLAAHLAMANGLHTQHPSFLEALTTWHQQQLAGAPFFLFGTEKLHCLFCHSVAPANVRRRLK